MVSYRLVDLIEKHSEVLAAKLLDNVRRSEFTRSFAEGSVSAEELRERVCEIYRHLGEWVLAKTDADLADCYRAIGARRYHQQVPLHELVWGIILAKQTLWEFLSWEAVPERPAEIIGELGLLQMIGSFFDRAIHYVILGYEDARRQTCDCRAAA
ncbi:MAG TPA: hypothetical protein VMT20_24555 [Terriglobia bacterium]|nr:hypothetical protein [Terriglobia bacterium]